MFILALFFLALFVLWLMVLLGWIPVLVAAIILRKNWGRQARSLRIVSCVWFLISIVVGTISYPYVKELVVSLPRKISISELAPFSDMYHVDRAKYGLAPIRETSDIRLERHIGRDATDRGYDAMLHMSGRNISRTVDFALVDGRYKWIGEQEIHYSGRTFKTMDGESCESISITYSTRKRSGTQKGLWIFYWGEDKALRSRLDLTLDDVRPIISRWDSQMKQ